MKSHIIFLILLLCFPIVLSIEAGSSGIITVLPECFGDYKIKVKGDVLSEQIGFEHCTLTEDRLWNCKCSKNKDTEVILSTQPNIKYKPFDIIVEHNIDAAMDRDNIRVKNFNNIQIGPISKPITKFEWPEIKGIDKSIFVLITIISLCFVVFVIIVLKKLFKDMFIDIENDEVSDKDVLDFIEKL